MLSQNSKKRVTLGSLFCLSILNAGCLSSANAQQNSVVLKQVASEVSSIIESGELKRLGGLMRGSITFDESGEIESNIRCFLNWNETCPNQRTSVQDIASREHFKYYYHLNDTDVIVSYIRSDKREEFYSDPERFLSETYLRDFFSCRFKLQDGLWLLQESVCYSETEGPFEGEPEV